LAVIIFSLLWLNWAWSPHYHMSFTAILAEIRFAWFTMMEPSVWHYCLLAEVTNDFVTILTIRLRNGVEPLHIVACFAADPVVMWWLRRNGVAWFPCIWHDHTHGSTYSLYMVLLHRVRLDHLHSWRDHLLFSVAWFN